jgi:hypothetical protein
VNITITGFVDGEPKVFDWTSNQGIDIVIAKAGAMGNGTYVYDPESLGDSGLTSPVADKNAISHITFCYDIDSTSTPTNTPEPTETNTPEPTATNTPEPTETNTPEPTETNTPEPTETNTPEPTETVEVTRTVEVTKTVEITSTVEVTRTVERTETAEPTSTKTPVRNRTRTPEATETSEPSPTNTVSSGVEGVASTPTPTGIVLPDTGVGVESPYTRIIATMVLVLAVAGIGVAVFGWDRRSE